MLLVVEKVFLVIPKSLPNMLVVMEKVMLVIPKSLPNPLVTNIFEHEFTIIDERTHLQICSCF